MALPVVAVAQGPQPLKAPWKYHEYSDARLDDLTRISSRVTRSQKVCLSLLVLVFLTKNHTFIKVRIFPLLGELF